MFKKQPAKREPAKFEIKNGVQRSYLIYKDGVMIANVICNEETITELVDQMRLSDLRKAINEVLGDG